MFLPERPSGGVLTLTCAYSLISIGSGVARGAFTGPGPCMVGRSLFRFRICLTSANFSESKLWVNRNTNMQGCFSYVEMFGKLLGNVSLCLGDKQRR